MRKFLTLTLLFSALCLSATSEAASFRRGGMCSYSPLQNVIKTARDASKIQELIANNIDFNAPQKCGGSIAQLAVIRGNPTVLNALISDAQLKIDGKVSLVDFPIPGAPKEVPFILFAAYYAPREEILTSLINARANVLQKDDHDENISWYLSKNPVLSETALSDEINKKLLMASVQKEDASVGDPILGDPNEKGDLVEAEPERAFGGR